MIWLLWTNNQEYFLLIKIITVTEDSSINVYDYSTKKEYISRKFYSTATCISIASQNGTFN